MNTSKTLSTQDEVTLTKMWLEDLRSELGTRIAAERALRAIEALEAAAKAKAA